MITRTKHAAKKDYKVFVSHAGDDIWVAEQLASCIENCGATAFLDRRDIAAGDDFKKRLQARLACASKYSAAVTPEADWPPELACAVVREVIDQGQRRAELPIFR